jgi:ABC-2 type transport system permease protein
LISKPLLKQTIRSNYKLFLIFTLVLCLYLTMVISFFTPATLEDFGGIMEGTPFGAVFGDMNSLLGFIDNAYFGIIAIIFPMIYSIIVGNKLIADLVDRGSMAYILSTPITRNKVTMTQAVYLTGSLLIMFFIVGGVGLLVEMIFQPNAMDTKTFILLIVGCFFLHFAISGITFIASCIFNLSRYSLGVGTGISLAFFLLKMIAELSESLDFFNYLTINTLFDKSSIMLGSGYADSFVILFVIGLVLYGVGMKVFKEKDLPL